MKEKKKQRRAEGGMRKTSSIGPLLKNPRSTTAIHSPLNLKTFFAHYMPNMYAKCHSKLSSDYGDIALLQVGLKYQRTTDGRPSGQPENKCLRLYYCWWRHKIEQMF